VSLSIPSLSALAGTPRVIIPGGEVDPVEGTIGGPLLERGLADLRLDTAIMTCCGVNTTDGVMAYNLRDAAAKQAAQRSAARTVLIAESSKFGKTALARICSLDEVSILVTDTGLPAAVRDYCAEHDVELRIVDAEFDVVLADGRRVTPLTRGLRDR
jgi:DeoR/GlpR family transcriptional regulator of sugar metabolism